MHYEKSVTFLQQMKPLRAGRRGFGLGAIRAAAVSAARPVSGRYFLFRKSHSAARKPTSTNPSPPERAA
jgi:hypothetical protein